MKIIFPYSYVYVFLFFLGIIPPLPQISGYTHWIVTQHGMIEPITSSYYHLKQSWNLIKLIHQEKNWNFVEKIEMKLNKVSNDLQANQDYQNKVQKYYVDSNSACVKASKLLSEFDLYSSHILTLEAKGISSISYLNEKHLTNNSSQLMQQPFCESLFKTNFSMCCFEHLESLRNRSLLNGVPEISLYKIALPQHLTPSEYGHLVALSLADNANNNSHNWILYNMAAFYWRVKGATRHAVECLRAALHTSPLHSQDIALVSLANVLHIIKSASLDAIVLLKNAVLISPQFASHHMMLGNIYASLAQFNNSLHHYTLAAKIHNKTLQANNSPNEKNGIKLQDIQDRIFAARCSYELSSAISTQQRKLDEQLQELELFQIETNQFQEAKMSLNFQRACNESQNRKQITYESFINEENERKLFVNECLKYDLITKQEEECELSEELLVASLFQDRDSIITNLVRKKQDIPKMNKVLSENIYMERQFHQPIKPRIYKQLFAPTINRQTKDNLVNINDSICKFINCIQENDVDKPIENNYHHLYTFLSPSNKGFDLDDILTSRQGLTSTDEHSLPWYPPYCMTYVNKSELLPIDIIDKLDSLNCHQQSQLPSYSTNIYKSQLMEQLAKLVHHNNKRMEDIGQRIVTAIKKQLLPQWILFNIAGLYWRVIGNIAQSYECHKLAAKLSPSQYLDVSLANLAVLLASINKNIDGLKLVKSALHIDYSEPETHIISAGLYNELEKYHLAHHHLSIAIKQNPHLKLSYFNLDFIKCQLCQQFYKNKSKQYSTNKKTELLQNVTKIFVKYKICSSIIECSNIIGRNYHFLPHIKVTIKGPTFSPSDIEKLTTVELDSMNKETGDSNVMYGMLWNTNLTNLHIQENDCLLTNDSSRSIGCHRNEQIYAASQNAINFLLELRALMTEVSESIIDNTSKKQSDNKHICYNKDKSKTTNPDENNSPTLKINSNDIQETIINLISSRVVLKPLVPEECEHVAPFDFKTYTPLYVSLNTMRINVVSLLDSLNPGYSFRFNQHPYCIPKGENFLRQIIEKHQVDFESSQHSKVPEYNLHASFLKTFDDKYSLEDIGKRLYTGLEQNATDWRLATIVVNYWRVSGDAQQAFNCLEVAMENSPEFHEKVILVNAANILYRINKLEAALEVTHKSMQYPDSQNWIVIPFLVANIFATMEQWHKATLFYEACLSLKSDFDEAIYRIKSIQCQQIMLQNLEQH